MAEILNAYGTLDDIISTIMIAYKNTNSIVRTYDGDTEFINISGGICKVIHLPLFIICIEYILH